MIAFLLFTTAAAADEAIVQVPEGSTVTVPGGKPFTVQTFSFLLPEPYYDEALSQAKQLRICEPALDRCTKLTTEWMDVAGRSLETCAGQFDVDESTIETLRAEVTTLESKAFTAETRLAEVRGQRNVAWAITGGLLLGVIATTSVAIGF